MKSFRTIAIIIAIIGILAYLFIPWYSSRNVKQDIKVQSDSILISKAQIKAIQAREIILLAKLHTDSIKIAEVIKRKDKAIQRLNKRLADKRPEVITEIDSLPDVKEFIAVQDSLNSELQSEVDTLKVQKVKTWEAFNKILTNSEDKFKASEELNKHLANINEIQADELSKRKRQNVGLKIGFIVLGVLAILK